MTQSRHVSYPRLAPLARVRLGCYTVTRLHGRLIHTAPLDSLSFEKILLYSVYSVTCGTATRFYEHATCELKHLHFMPTTDLYQVTREPQRLSSA